MENIIFKHTLVEADDYTYLYRVFQSKVNSLIKKGEYYVIVIHLADISKDFLKELDYRVNQLFPYSRSQKLSRRRPYHNKEHPVHIPTKAIF